MGEFTEEELREALKVLEENFTSDSYESCENLVFKLDFAITELMNLRKKNIG